MDVTAKSVSLVGMRHLANIERTDCVYPGSLLALVEVAEAAHAFLSDESAVTREALENALESILPDVEHAERP